MLDFFTFQHFDKYDTLLHAVTKKSKDFPHTFSLALHTGEAHEAIVKNRHALAKTLERGVPLTYIIAQQTHSNNIKIIRDTSAQGWNELSSAIEDCDALISNVPHVVLGMLTADCVPILLFDPVQQVVAAIHAGWKGTQLHITQNTVKSMTEAFECNPKNILAGIAPSIGSCCYEVGEDVAQHFFNIPQSLIQKEDKYMLDLPYINKIQLEKAGLQTHNIEMSHICTACDTKHYFSYRKEHGCSGRFMSLIGIRTL